MTCSQFTGAARTIPGAVVVFEIVSPTSSRIDRIIKVREYAAVPSIRRYVILKLTSVALPSSPAPTLANPGQRPRHRRRNAANSRDQHRDPGREFYADADFSGSEDRNATEL